MNNLEELKPVGKLSPFAHFCCTIGNLPTSYMISLTYEEQLLWLCQYLEKTVIPAVNTNAEAVAELQNLYIQLKEYVDNYFTNLDVQSEINKKLDEMAQSGELEEIISSYLNSNAILSFNNINEMINSQNIVEGSVVKTLGKNNFNDGEGRFYKIEKIQNATNVDGINLINLLHDDLYARLIKENYLTEIEDNKEKINNVNNNIDYLKSNFPKIIAHRGASLEAPENTIPAFQIAGQQKFYGCETDVIESSDGIFYCFHDDNVDRMTDGTGSIRNMTSTQINSLNIDAGNNIDYFNNLKIPTFEQYLQECFKYNLVPVIEIKSISNVTNLLNLIKKYGFENKCIIICFNTNILENIRQLSPTIKIQALLNLTIENINYCKQHNFGIDFELSTFNIDLIRYAHSLNIELNVWTINNNDNTFNLLSNFVDYITSNAFLFTISTSSPLYNINNIKLYSNDEFNNIAIGGTEDYSNELKTLLNRAYADTTKPFPILYEFSAYRMVCFNKIKLKSSSVVNYEIPEGYKFTITPFNNQNKLITDLGWFTGTSKTDFPSSISYGIAYFKKSDDSYISEVDKNIMRKIIKSVIY